MIPHVLAGRYKLEMASTLKISARRIIATPVCKAARVPKHYGQNGGRLRVRVVDPGA